MHKYSYLSRKNTLFSRFAQYRRNIFAIINTDGRDSVNTIATIETFANENFPENDKPPTFAASKRKKI